MADKQIVYISGKITGLDIEVAKHHFALAEQRIIESGHEAVNPMTLVPYDPALTWVDYMVEDIRGLLGCTAILMLENWEDSRGAKIEHAIAMEMGIKVHKPETYYRILKEECPGCKGLYATVGCRNCNDTRVVPRKYL